MYTSIPNPIRDPCISFEKPPEQRLKYEVSNAVTHPPSAYSAVGSDHTVLFVVLVSSCRVANAAEDRKTWSKQNGPRPRAEVRGRAERREG